MLRDVRPSLSVSSSSKYCPHDCSAQKYLRMGGDAMDGNEWQWRRWLHRLSAREREKLIQIIIHTFNLRSFSFFYFYFNIIPYDIICHQLRSLIHILQKYVLFFISNSSPFFIFRIDLVHLPHRFVSDDFFFLL